MESSTKKEGKQDGGGPCLWAQHLGDRDKWIAEFEFQYSQGYTKEPCLKKTKQNKTEKQTNR